jgi:hypothetical protein
MAVWAVSTGTLPMPYISGAGASFLAVGDLQDVYADSRSESSLGFSGADRICAPAGTQGASVMVTLDFARPSLGLLIRVPDTNPVQESPVIRRIDCRLCVRQSRRCRSETSSPTIRERFHSTDASAAPWTSPVNHEFML